MMNISFIVPVYNCKPYLARCVADIRSVGLREHEIILVDDGSTDGSGDICDELAAQFPRIRVIHQANAGASAARNRGLREASGTHILFLDADDNIEPKLLGEILGDPNCLQADLVIFGLTFDYYRKGKRYRRDPLFYPADGLLSKQAWGEAFNALYENNAVSPVWNKVFRRSILLEQSLELNEGMFLYEDLEFVLRYLRHCDRILNIPLPVYHYRQAEDEGNARRRLARIDSLPGFLMPIENALTALTEADPVVGPEQTARVLQHLYLVLAREKIAVSSWAEVKRICRDFARWSEERTLPLAASRFQKNLQNGSALYLLLSDRKTKLRHRAAVWVKARLARIQEEKHG
jgi:glycosyltransferase involved in cell wall biosynthesis